MRRTFCISSRNLRQDCNFFGSARRRFVRRFYDYEDDIDVRSDHPLYQLLVCCGIG